MELFELVKSALRVTTSDEGIEAEIYQLIDSAKEDLKTAGVSADIANDEDNDLVRQAVIFYAKANFGFDNPDASRFRTMFELKKDTLALGTDYEK